MRERIPWAKPDLGEAEKKLLVEALDSTWISGGPFVDRLEAEFTALHGLGQGSQVPGGQSFSSPGGGGGGLRGLTTSNGTTALQLALAGLEIGRGAEVIVPGLTFVAPANMVLAMGAVPVFADIDPRTWCLDPAQVEARLTPRTKAILCVHLYGNVCAMDALADIARRRGIPLIEDAAQAVFSKYRGRYAGTFGSAGCFSFHATKTITTGEGGFVLTPDAGLFERMRVLRDHGMRSGKRYWHDVLGYNFRLTNLQAAVGCAQMARRGEFLEARKRMVRSYLARLAGIPGVAPQYFPPEVEPAVWAVAVKLDAKAFGGDRDWVIERLSEAGIETRPGFYPMSAMPPYQSARLAVSEDVGLNVLSLPSFPAITAEQIARVCDSLRALKR